MVNAAEILDENYFEWLYSLVAVSENRNPARSYRHLCDLLFNREFTYFVPNDDNRAAEGMELREEWMHSTGIDVRSSQWFDCTFLEMLVSLARRAAFQTDMETGEWFWIMARNLGWDLCTDNRFNWATAEEIHLQVSDILNRTYAPSGRGGLFPLRGDHEDQREVELWYQLSNYIVENFL